MVSHVMVLKLSGNAQYRLPGQMLQAFLAKALAAISLLPVKHGAARELYPRTLAVIWATR